MAISFGEHPAYKRTQDQSPFSPLPSGEKSSGVFRQNAIDNGELVPVAVNADALDEKKSFSGFVGNILPSAEKLVGDFATMVAHPIDTLTGVSKVATGALDWGIEKLTGAPSENETMQENRASFDAFKQGLVERYGSLEAVKNTAYKDPVGFALDLATVLEGGSGALRKAGMTGAAKAVGRVAETINPVTQTLRGVGKLAETATAGKEIGLSKTFKPEVAQIASEEGVTLPVSALTTSKTVQGSEALLGRGLFGDGLIKTATKAREDISRLSQEAEMTALKAIEDTTKPYIEHAPDVKSVGVSIQKGFNAFNESFQKTKTALYDAVPEDIRSTKAVTDSTVSAVKDVLDQARASLVGSPVESLFQDLMGKLMPAKSPITFEQLKQTRSQIGQMLKSATDPVVTGAKAQLNKLYAALSEDLDATLTQNYPDAKEALDTANEFYRTNLEKINSTVGKAIENADPEKLVDSIVRKNSETAIQTVKEITSPEAFSSLQSSFLSKLFLKSVKDGFVDVQKLQKLIAGYEPGTLTALLGEEGYSKLQSTLKDLEGIKSQEASRLERIGKLGTAMKQGTKMAEGSQTAFLSKLGLRGIATTIGSTLSPHMLLALVGDIAGEYAATKFFMSKFGKEFLTSGVKLDGSTGKIILKKATSLGKKAGIIKQIPQPEE